MEDSEMGGPSGQAAANHDADADDVYSDLDSEEFVEDMRAYGVRQTLPISAEDEEFGYDEEALAYLRHVRAEAARIPTVCVSTINAREFDDRRTTSYTRRAEDLSHVPDPPHPWVCEVVDQFIAARHQVTLDRQAPQSSAPKLPVLHDRQAWNRLIAQEHFQPLSTTLARMDNTLATHCLSHLVTQAGQNSALSGHLGLWMYGLMVRIEKPIQVAVAATMREVSKLARKQRPVASGEGLTEEQVAQIAMYDTLLVVAGGFFGQDERMAPVVDTHIALSTR